MKETLVPIDRAGRVVLPKNVREDLAIRPGDLLEVTIRGNEVILLPKTDPAGFIRKGRALVFSTGTDDPLNRETVEAILAEAREGRCAEIAPA